MDNNELSKFENQLIILSKLVSIFLIILILIIALVYFIAACFDIMFFPSHCVELFWLLIPVALCVMLTKIINKCNSAKNNNSISKSEKIFVYFAAYLPFLLALISLTVLLFANKRI